MIALTAALLAATVSGRVTCNTVAVPGATVTAAQGPRSVSTTTNEEGEFTLASLEDGAWLLRVDMRGFVPAMREIVVPLHDPLPPFALSLQPLADIVGRRPPAVTTLRPPPVEVTAAPAADLDLVNGSVMNGAVTPFAQPRAFGNNRPGRPPLYNGLANIQFGNSRWNAKPYSMAGSGAPPPSFTNLQGSFAVGGPLRIPWLIKYGPQTFVSFERGTAHNAVTHAAVVPSETVRAGDFGVAAVLRDPLSGEPFANGVIPAARIDSAARALVSLYPLPNADSAFGNFEAPIVTATTHDALQASIAGTSRNRATSLGANVAFRRTSIDSTDLFGFADESRQSSLTASGSWARRLTSQVSLRARYEFTYEAFTLTPFFANRTNVSAEAGISGNDQRPESWGPPALLFPDILDLRDQDFARTRRHSHAVGGELVLRRGNHSVTTGGDARWLTTDVLSQPDPRGTLTFTGELSGNAFADFLLGLPAASAMAFAGTSTRLGGGTYDAYLNDDWRPRANLTLNLGVRWEYDSPFTEADNRLSNLDVDPAFTSARAVVASASDRSLISADRLGLEPRVSMSWRPSPASPLIIRAGYGLYRNLGVYESLALLLAQQPPFFHAANVQTSRSAPLALASPFSVPASETPNTVAIDRHLRSAQAHTWQISAQRELPASLTVTAAYVGTKGSRLMQAYLPNTYPRGGIEACDSCPSGFVFVGSDGSSLRHAGQFTVRRRLHDGFTASAQYTLAKAVDDASSFSNGGVTIRSLTIAQDWLDLGAERGPSAFDQRHLITLAFQFTSGARVAGQSTQTSSWDWLRKDWTLGMQLTAGSGLPFTPVAFVSKSGSAFVGQRPILTGESPRPVVEGTYANPAAYVTPPSGMWGTAGRNSIRGPAALSLDGALSRLLPLRGRLTMEARLTATNLFNRVTFDAIDAVISSPQFGRPSRANPMRAIQAGIRLRF